jgi:hypothetical protein
VTTIRSFLVRPTKRGGTIIHFDAIIRPLGPVECDQLIAQVLRLSDDIWKNNPYRQDEYQNVHGQTQSVVLIFCTGWPSMEITQFDIWSEFKSSAGDLIFDVLKSHYPPGGVILRAMFTKLPAGTEIPRHRDSHSSFEIAHRIHIPLVTNPDVEFIIGDEKVELKEKSAFEINNLMPHQVKNNGDTDRIHFIFDYAPPGN